MSGKRSALDALSTAEKAAVLDELLAARPDLRQPAEAYAAQALQGVLDIVGDSRPVGARHDPGGAGFSQLAQVRPGSEQLIQHGGFLGCGQGVQR